MGSASILALVIAGGPNPQTQPNALHKNTMLTCPQETKTDCIREANTPRNVHIFSLGLQFFTYI